LTTGHIGCPGLSFDGWCDGVRIYVLPFGVRRYECLTAVYDSPNLGLERFSGVGF